MACARPMHVLAERLVTAGHHAIAIDYFGRTAGTGERGEDFECMPHVMQTTPAQVQADVAAAREALAARTDARRFVTLGFCFGGAQSDLCATNPDLGLDAFEAVLSANGVDAEIHVYPGAPPSFFDRSQEDFAEASTYAWERVLDFLGRVDAGVAA